ncbi:MAG: outer membrane lipoprotein-sorting protein [Brevinematia bacterium]
MNKKSFLLMILLFSVKSFSLTPEDILKLVDKWRGPSSSFLIDLKVSSYSKDEIVESLEMKGYVKGKKSMVYFTSPAKWKGRKMLMVGNDVLMIFPNTSKPVRLSPSQRLMGDVANGDVARLTFSQDYNASLLGEEGDSYILKLVAKTEGTTYHSIILWVKKDNFVPIKATFFSLSGKELKTAYYSELKTLGGEERISKITIYDAIKKDNYSVIEFLNMEEKMVADKYFNIEFLMEM